MDNVAGLVEVPISLWGGVDIELSPTDLPQGLSPDSLNLAYLPGSAFTRPPQARFSSLGGTSQIVYTTSYTTNSGDLIQLVFDSMGRMWANGVQIGTTKAGNRFKSVAAFGREYLAISDGLHGADVPLQFFRQNGTDFLDRVSQDGPGGAPTLANYSLPAVALVTGSTGASVSITSMTPTDPQQVQVGTGNQNPYEGGYQPPVYETYYTALEVLTAAPHGLTVNESIAISGNTLYNSGSFYVVAIDSTTSFRVGLYSQSNAVGTGGSVNAVTALLVRNNNQVTAATAVPHNLRAGYQVAIAGVADATQSITSITMDNETLPGFATVVTPAPHGFVPGNSVSIAGVQPTLVGGPITAYTIADNVCTATTTTDHGLQPGTSVLVSLKGGPPTPAIVDAVPSLNTFSFSKITGDTTGTVGYVELPWPVASGTQFVITAIPSATSFEIAISATDAVWNSGTISFSWNGTFFVSAVPSATSFIYSQAGPNNSVQTGTGTATPIGQLTPGPHKCVCIFQTRTGYLTYPSVSVTLAASGSQYMLVTDIPIGPPNVVARILAFTGANGARYYYLPVAPQLNGQLIGTSTVVNDNITTSAVFDFSDQALLSATAIDIPGNNLFNQVVLGPCLGMFAYAGRIFAWGERNKIQQFQNMGFEGGYYASAPTLPLGWDVTGSCALNTSGDYGQALTLNGSISQSAYQDQFGIAILQPQTQYTARLWASGAGNITFDLFSPTAGVLATVSLPVTRGFVEGTLSAQTPITIPADTVIRLTGSGEIVDEIELYYTDNPYLRIARASYVNNPEAFDGVTGLIGPASDPNEIRAMFQRKDVLHMLTEGPDGSLYEAYNTPSGEPATWNINHVSAKCGAISVWGDAQFEDWQVWASDTGLRIYNGGEVDKMSQEVQPWWDTLNENAKQFSVVANDPYTRRIYTLLPTGTASIPNSCYVLDYRELNTAGALSSATPLHIGMGGKVLTTDLTRKWCPWSILANYCTIINIGGGAQMAFCSGSGTVISDPAYGSVYTLDEGVQNGLDDDYGPFSSYVTTYYFVSQDEAQQLGLGLHRKLYIYLTLYVSGSGQVVIYPLVDRAGFQWPATPPMPLQLNPDNDYEVGLNISGERVAFKIVCLPNAVGPTSQAALNINNLVVGMKTHPMSPVRGRI